MSRRDNRLVKKTTPKNIICPIGTTPDWIAPTEQKKE